MLISLSESKQQPLPPVLCDGGKEERMALVYLYLYLYVYK